MERSSYGSGSDKNQPLQIETILALDLTSLNFNSINHRIFYFLFLTFYPTVSDCLMSVTLGLASAHGITRVRQATLIKGGPKWAP